MSAFLFPFFAFVVFLFFRQHVAVVVMMQVNAAYVHLHGPTMTKVKPTFTQGGWLMLDFRVVLSGSKLHPLTFSKLHALLHVGSKMPTTHL
jgi:hypothetical protein